MIRINLKAVFLFLLACSAAVILWITVFSRIGADLRELYLPLNSYQEIFSGNVRFLMENVENILLFLPIGASLTIVLHLDLRQTALLSLAFSLLIECSQWLFWLGSLEFDDLLHNTLGAMIGAVFILKTGLGRSLQQMFNRKDLLPLLALTVAILAVPLCGKWVETQQMKRFAAMSDREDGRENLLVLDGNDGYVGSTGVYVSYNDDGTVSINGSADQRSWYILGKITLPAGTYRLTGFPSTPKNTFNLELEYLDRDQRKYLHFVSLDTEQSVEISLLNKTKFRVLIGVFPGAKGKVLCKPAIFSED